ncbi:MAG: tetratricopeptide repeat protein [Candidatus Ancaeobacter aquaticus]|nr:tetratricopeptide repeat protein [Candidatus Ancaeobacter aquaticus]
MRRLSILFVTQAILVICLCAPGFAQKQYDNFYKGNIAYEKGEYDQAAQDYEGFLKNGYESGNVYYNLGNTYWKLRNIGKSILFYEKALRLMPGDADTLANLNFVQRELEDVPEKDNRNWFLRMLDYFFAGISLDGLTILCGVFLWMACIVGIAYLFLKNRWSSGLKYPLIVGNVFIVLLLILVIRVEFYENIHYGIVLNKEIEVKYGPVVGDAVAFTLHEGSKVCMEHESHDWYQIYFSKGKVGWVRKSTLGVI